MEWNRWSWLDSKAFQVTSTVLCLLYCKFNAIVKLILNFSLFPLRLCLILSPLFTSRRDMWVYAFKMDGQMSAPCVYVQCIFVISISMSRSFLVVLNIFLKLRFVSFSPRIYVCMKQILLSFFLYSLIHKLLRQFNFHFYSNAKE